MYGLTTIHKLNREAAEAAAILAKYGEQKGSPKFDAILAEYRKEQAEKEGTGLAWDFGYKAGELRSEGK